MRSPALSRAASSVGTSREPGGLSSSALVLSLGSPSSSLRRGGRRASPHRELRHPGDGPGAGPAKTPRGFPEREDHADSRRARGSALARDERRRREKNAPRSSSRASDGKSRKRKTRRRAPRRRRKSEFSKPRSRRPRASAPSRRRRSRPKSKRAAAASSRARRSSPSTSRTRRSKASMTDADRDRLIDRSVDILGRRR